MGVTETEGGLEDCSGAERPERTGKGCDEE